MWTLSFSRFDLDIPLWVALSCSHSGNCVDDIERATAVPELRAKLDALSATDVRAELREYGFDNSDLVYHADNLRRILWLACGNIAESLATGDYDPEDLSDDDLEYMLSELGRR
jgi:hypothetical protein